MESFEKIPDYPNYEVSNFGYIRNIKSGKILKGYSLKGYIQVDLWNDGKHKRFFVHRVVAKAFIPNPENKPEVNHKDYCRSNNYYLNLDWATSEENIQHSRLKPRKSRKTRLQKILEHISNSYNISLSELENIAKCHISSRKLKGFYKIT